MAAEPINIFSRMVDPAGVARKLRELGDIVEIDGPDDNWRKAVVTFRKWWRKKTLTINHNPGYYAEPGWSAQMDGMRGFFSQFPDTARKPKVLALTTTFRFAISAVFEPDADPDGDPRLSIVFYLAEFLDGILFISSALLDAQGRVLFGTDGEEYEDADAVWPRVVGSVPIESAEGMAMHEASWPKTEGDENAAVVEAPTAFRVARRALAITALTARAMLENDGDMNRIPDICGEVLAWVEDFDIDRELEPEEKEFVRAAPGTLDYPAVMNFTWRLEGLAVLAWALGKFELPLHDQLVDSDSLWDSLGFLDPDKSQALLDHASLRPRAELQKLKSRLFAAHWRMRDFRLNRGTIDFVKFAKDCRFGPLDISGLPIIGGDLGVRGVRIDQASTQDVAETHSSAQERHLAVNWLLDGPEQFSDASVAT
ncbi:MAG TPA: DUF4272 domain-containing protein [Chthoniobacter sp.]|nr:DUF4272 domain-containing protein [Chthoniobacter sp.]